MFVRPARRFSTVAVLRAKHAYQPPLLPDLKELKVEERAKIPIEPGNYWSTTVQQYPSIHLTEPKVYTVNEASADVTSSAMHKTTEIYEPSPNSKNVQMTGERVKESVDKAADRASEVASDLKGKTESASGTLKDGVKKVSDTLKEEAPKVAEKVESTLKYAQKEAFDAASDLKDKAQDFKESVDRKLTDGERQGLYVLGGILVGGLILGGIGKRVTATPPSNLEEAKKKSVELKGEALEKAEHLKDKAADKASELKGKAIEKVEEVKKKLEK